MDDRSTAIPVSFTGSGKDYFGIWIVNLLLTIVTFGIYSAWAKVRRMHFFYRHTSLGGAGFDYHGEPFAILKGRTIAFLMLMAYQFSGGISPMLGVVSLLLLMAIFPWLMHRSLRFRLHNSSHRGLRFAFHGSLGEAYVVFLALPLAAAVSLGLLFPLWMRQFKVYQYGDSAFGRSNFECKAPVGAFYRIYLGAALALVAMLLVGGLLLGQEALSGISLQSRVGREATVGAGLLLLFGFLVALLGVGPFVAAHVQNVVWNSLRLGPHRFESRVSGRRLAFIAITNLIGVVFTLGLYRPFAEVRLMKYRLACISMIPAGDLDSFLADSGGDLSAVGEESAEMFDFDIGL